MAYNIYNFIFGAVTLFRALSLLENRFVRCRITCHQINFVFNYINSYIVNGKSVPTSATKLEQNQNLNNPPTTMKLKPNTKLPTCATTLKGLVYFV